MKKGHKKHRMTVVYKGDKWKLHEGHQVFNVNSNDPVGIVKLSDLERYYPFNPFYWIFFFKNGPYYQPKDRRDFVIHLTARHRDLAVTKFKTMFKGVKTVHNKQYEIK